MYIRPMEDLNTKEYLLPEGNYPSIEELIGTLEEKGVGVIKGNNRHVTINCSQEQADHLDKSISEVCNNWTTVESPGLKGAFFNTTGKWEVFVSIHGWSIRIKPNKGLDPKK